MPGYVRSSSWNRSPTPQPPPIHHPHPNSNPNPHPTTPSLTPIPTLTPTLTLAQAIHVLVQVHYAAGIGGMPGQQAPSVRPALLQQRQYSFWEHAPEVG